MVIEDVRKACDVSAGIDNGTFSKIYFSSNESLNNLFKCFSVKDKEVLTVLGSSDQLLYSYYHGARNVDSFDVNYLTKYYYYLRRWTILYNKNYYPSRRLFKNHSYIEDLLDKVKCMDDEEDDAISFWRGYIDEVTPDVHENLYCMDYHNNGIRDVKRLRSILVEEPFHFYHINLFDEVTCHKKYDIIITSNILEYAWNPLKLQKSHDNLKSLLKDNGQIIGSHFVFKPDSDNFKAERNYFENDFEYSEFKPYREKYGFKTYPLGYSYTKKKC